MIKFKTTSGTGVYTLKKVEVIRETEKSVFFENGYRELKHSSYCQYWDTFEDAKTYKLSELKNKREALKYQLNLVKNDYERLFCLTEENLLDK